MKVVVLFCLALGACASADVKIQYHYHKEVGIPTATRIKNTEDLISSKKSDKIVGGYIAPVHAHPYLAGLVIHLMYSRKTSVCGSSLLTPNRLVTAAHCWWDGESQAWQFTVVLGSQRLYAGGLRIRTRRVISHPGWIPSSLLNDVAMIYLPTNVPYSKSIQPISLPNRSDLSNNFVGDWAIAAGYGITSDWQTGVAYNTVISQVKLQVISVAQCSRVFGWKIRGSNICTNGQGNVGICGGDSGGPLLTVRNGRPTLIGISSFVSLAGCQLGFPSAFTRVTSFNDFINQHL